MYTIYTYTSLLKRIKLLGALGYTGIHAKLVQKSANGRPQQIREVF